ncbi:MAG: hypothetical protein HDT28_06945 [Clostridiales bacterium]|nr:hypothetical protein [Clostridiales bacterium]
MSNFFESRLAEWKEQIDERLEKLVGELHYAEPFKEVLRYALFPGGKRLRPILTLELHSLFCPPDEYALDYACGIEMLHSYSLIHDDMPCMDNDDYRRDKLTVHKRYGEGVALLAGDALLDLSYRILSCPMPDGKSSPFIGYSGAGGDMGLIRGQYSDLYGEITSLDELFKMYDFKTGALIRLACDSGYALGNRSRVSVVGGDLGRTFTVSAHEEVDESAIIDSLRVNDFARAFGRAFQLYDDISEYLEGLSIGERSVLKFLDLDDAKKELNLMLNNAAKKLDLLGGDTRFLNELVQKFVIV